MQEQKPVNEFDYQTYMMMEPEEQAAYLQICRSLLESGTETVVVNGPDSGLKLDSVEALNDWLELG
jgi:hypothetical protein